MNTIKPYKGTDPYIFISYSHKDTAKVLPIIAEMQAEGYRVWYDEGIDPGTEWDEFIAQKLLASSFVVSMISENYLRSSNCKDELKYARDQSKEQLLIYVGKADLPAGMQMRFGGIQAIFEYKYTNKEQFFEKLFSTNALSVAKTPEEPITDEPNSADTVNIQNSAPLEFPKNTKNIEQVKTETKETSDQPVIRSQGKRSTSKPEVSALICLALTVIVAFFAPVVWIFLTIPALLIAATILSTISSRSKRKLTPAWIATELTGLLLALISVVLMSSWSESAVVFFLSFICNILHGFLGIILLRGRNRWFGLGAIGLLFFALFAYVLIFVVIA